MYMDELKSQNIWLCWNFETRKGKRTKIPRAASGKTTGTNETYAHTWVTYEEARKAAQDRHYDGIGFKIPDGYFFLDIDHKETTDPYVKTILNRFHSYTERSVSGHGIHIYGKCDMAQLPTVMDDKGKRRLDKAFYMKNSHNNTELYCGSLTNRFAIYTGDVILPEPLRDCTEALLVTLENDMRRKPKVPAIKANTKCTKTTNSKCRERNKENENRGNRIGSKNQNICGKSACGKDFFSLITNLTKQKNGDKFSKLYHDGDTSDYGSPSEADCALCAMIAFRTGPDAMTIDKVFRTSALYREKWEREDYRTATIAQGIEACHEVFHKSQIPHPSFIRFNEITGAPYVVVPLLAQYVREHLSYILVRDSGKQALLKYVYDNGLYRLVSNDMLLGLIKHYIAEYDEELVRMRQITETLQLLTTDLNYVSQDELDAQENLINFKNGLLYVDETKTDLFPHTPSVYSTIQIPCEWTENPSPTPIFDRYMHILTNGNKAVEQLLLEFIGVCLSNVKGWRLKKSLFLVGEGDTGKSQLKSLVERLLGRGNFIGIDLKEIEARFGTGAIFGTRLAGSSDMSFLSVDELKTFKKITGGDSLYAEFKGQQAFEFTYNGLLWFCMNRLPKFGGDNGQWVYDRILVVNCPNVIPKEEQDKNLLDKMYAERNGIVYKAVRALQQVIRNGYRFTEPPSITEARQNYRAENSTVISFFEECMCPWPEKKIQKHCTTGRIYRVYQAWCRDNNAGFAKTAREFRQELAEHLKSTHENLTTRRKGNTYYKDYTLTLETKEEYAKEYGFDTVEFV